MKKFFKKYTPDRDDVKEYKMLNFLGSSLFHKDLWKFNRISFCRATVIGLFWGWMPMMFQMIPAAYCAVVFRANLPLSVAGVWISNPITMPAMMYFAYIFGNNILGLNPIYNEFKLNSEWIISALGNIWEPLLVGTLIIGVVSSVIGYFLMHISWKIYAYSRLKRRK
ncbi:MAG: ATP-binding protein [Gammaproteobacteria bacterium]|nr:ATP-binding protein [Gammaproteobacteria bacterium]